MCKDCYSLSANISNGTNKKIEEHLLWSNHRYWWACWSLKQNLQLITSNLQLQPENLKTCAVPQLRNLVSPPKRVLKPCKTISTLCLLCSVEQIQRFHSDKKDSCHWKTWTLLHWWTLSLVGNQFISLNFVRNICILSSLRENRVHLFSIICIFFFFFGMIWVQSYTHVVKMWLNHNMVLYKVYFFEYLHFCISQYLVYKYFKSFAYLRKELI